MTGAVLSDGDVERFVSDGTVVLEGAFSRDLAAECRHLLWLATGCDEHDRSTWTRPVIRIDGRRDAPFVAAANTERLHGAFDQLAGSGRWVPRESLGTFPIRFPTEDAPNDDGWHIEGTGANANGELIVDPASHERVLLLLFLFSDVGPDDAPTRVRLGSHRAAARLLFGTGRPVEFFRAARELTGQTESLPEVAATGKAGDVWLCHPFVVHAAQRHRGTEVKFMAQPPLPGIGPINPNRPAHERSPVEQAVQLALLP
jgi:Phytanoyl-CoA dioxygenase (PhyH)